MNRLTKRSGDTTHENGVCCTHFGGRECTERSGNCAADCPHEEAAWAKLAEYEDLEEQGRLVVLPCKVGDTVYRFQSYFDDSTLTSKIKIKPCEVESFSIYCLITTDHVWISYEQFGKTVFYTREEAERALGGADDA